MTVKPLKTIGGQIVGRTPLLCEGERGSGDYCCHCGRDLSVANFHPCPVLEELRLEHIPDEDVAAFGCWREEADPSDPEAAPCKKWCHRALCAFALKSEASK